MNETRRISAADAQRVAAALGIDQEAVDVEQFRRGLEVELEHGARDPETDVTGDDMALTGKIAWAHLKEFPDYYTRLARMEAEADAVWRARHRLSSEPSVWSPAHTPAHPAGETESS